MRVLAHEHEPEPEHRLAVPVGGHGPTANLVPDNHLGHVPDVDRHAVLGLDHDVADLVEVLDPADAVDERGFAAAEEVAAADVAIVLLQGRDNFTERQVVLDE